jgi:hypothetical protein
LRTRAADGVTGDEVRRVVSCIIESRCVDIVDGVDVLGDVLVLGVVVWADTAPALIVRAMAAPMAREVVNRIVITSILRSCC